MKWTLVSILLLSFMTFGQKKAKYYNMEVAYGNLHAHSNLSDDVHDDENYLTPEFGYNAAREAGLDFIAITDHHKAPDCNHRLYLEIEEYKNDLYQVAMDINDEYVGEFIAIPGIEWGNTATGNHVNVLGLNVLPGDDILDKQYDKLYEFVKANGGLIQFNHPKSWSWKSNRDKSVGNFGINLYEDEVDFRNKVDEVVKTISIICSVKGGHIGGAHKHSKDKTHRDMQWLNFYKWYLNLGFHISPAANQDTHWENFGSVTAARTAVWTKEKNYEALMESIDQNRIYATEDDEMVVVYQVDYDKKRHWMGETVDLQSEKESVDIITKVWQCPGSDNDQMEEGPYTIEIFYDADGLGGNEAYSYKKIEGVKSSKFLRTTLEVTSGTYAFIQVTEEGGQDNLVGQGDDENNNETGEGTPDGKRDDPNDQAWTTAIWFD